MSRDRSDFCIRTVNHVQRTCDTQEALPTTTIAHEISSNLEKRRPAVVGVDRLDSGLGLGLRVTVATSGDVA
jgi:hypothetical protein